MEKRMNKKEQRCQLRTWRNSVDATLRETWSREICNYLLQHILLQETKHIYAYSAIASEVSLQHLIMEMLSQEKMIGLPAVCGENMEFYAISKDMVLKEGAFHIMEPQPSSDRWMQYENGICLVPGLGFDRSGNRIGYGKGYYDRYLASYPQLLRIGCCFDGQLIHQIACEENDLPMDYIVTQSGWIACKRNEDEI